MDMKLWSGLVRHTKVHLRAGSKQAVRAFGGRAMEVDGRIFGWVGTRSPDRPGT